MAKILDLNAIRIPTLELIFTDEAHTAIHVTAPSESLINEMETWIKTNSGTLAAGDEESKEAAFDMVARLISCNREHLSISAEDLRGKYGVDLWLLIEIIKGYTDFISEIKNAKN